MTPFKSSKSQTVGSLIECYGTSSLGLEFGASSGASSSTTLGTQSDPARSAKDLLDNGKTSNGLYYLNMHGTISATQHYCLLDTAYDGGGWTLLITMAGSAAANNFASGSNYAFSVDVNPNSPSITTKYGRDRRNTFTPAANDEFMIRRESNNSWVRFVVSTWSPTANSVSNGWETLNTTSGSSVGHPYFALGQMYDSAGNSVSGVTHFNGCAIGGNCGSGGGDGVGFGNKENYLNRGVDRAWGGAFLQTSNSGAGHTWDTTDAVDETFTYWYRKNGTQ